MTSAALRLQPAPVREKGVGARGERSERRSSSPRGT